MLTAIHFKSKFLQRREHGLGIMHVVIYGSLNLLLSFWCVDGFCCPLRDITGSVELRTLSTIPQVVQRNALSANRGGRYFFRNDRISTSYARETCRLGIRVKFDGTFACSANLIDAMWNGVVLYICLVCRMEEDERIILQSIVHPLAEFVFRKRHTRRIVRIAEINHVYATVGYLWNKTIFSRTRHINHV